MKYILITGANGGLASSIVDDLLKKGEFVFGLDISEPKIRDNYLGINTDVTNDESVKKALEIVKQKTDHLDAIINTAGIVRVGAFVEEEPSISEKIIEINLLGMIRINYYFFPLIEKGKGRIINFSSEYGKYTTIPFNGFYTMSKHAVESYSDGLRRELKYLNIPVITIRPGAFITGMQKSTFGMFDELLLRTKHYEKTLKRLYPLLDNGTKNAKDPSVLSNVVMKAIYSNKPHYVYKKNHDLKVKLMSILPSKTIDLVFNKLFK